MKGLATTLFLLLSGPATAEPGRLLYFGEMPGAQILGRSVAAPACASCHGRDAGGGAEGRLRIPAIDPTDLAARHGRYDYENFAAALITGKGADGRVLSNAMPRFPGAAQSDLAALWSFLEVVAQEDRNGVTATSIQFVVPALVGQEYAAVALCDALERHWQTIGRIYNREPHFEVALAGDGRKLTDAFAAIGPLLDAEGRLAQAIRVAGLALIGPRGRVDTTATADTVFLQARPVDVERLLRVMVATAAAPDSAEKIARSQTGDFILLNPSDAIRLAALPVDVVAGHEVHLSAQTAAEVPDALAIVAARGGETVIAQPAGDSSNPDQLAAVVVSGLAQTLRAAGRNLTRTRFLAAWKKVRIETGAWPRLDYSLHPQTGTENLTTTRVSP